MAKTNIQKAKATQTSKELCENIQGKFVETTTANQIQNVNDANFPVVPTTDGWLDGWVIKVKNLKNN